jgi:predicted nucleotidyltransferase
VEQSRAWWQDRSRVFLAECARVIQATIGAGAVEAVVLAGSAASGEETIILDAEPPILLSDMDLLVVLASERERRQWYDRRAALGSACEALLPDVRFSGRVEPGVMLLDDLRRMPARPGVLDMKRRGRVLAGKAGVLDVIPAYEAADITAREAVLLIENRIVSLLDCSTSPSSAGGVEPYRFAYEIARTYTDIATAALSIAGRYAPGYAARRELLRTAIQEERHPVLLRLVPPALFMKIDRSTRFKIDPSRREAETMAEPAAREGAWRRAAADVLAFWKRTGSPGGASFAEWPDELPVGAFIGESRSCRDWRRHAVSWRSFLGRYSVAKRIAVVTSMGGRLFEEGPLDVVREHGLRLLEHRLLLGPRAPVSGCRFGFPHHGGRWEDAARELCSLWKELVFGRRGS